MSLTDELNRFQNILAALNNLTSNIEAVTAEVKTLKSSLITNFNMDSKGLEEDNLNDAITDLDNALGALTGDYIRMVNDRIAELKEAIAREEEEKRKKESESNN